MDLVLAIGASLLAGLFFGFVGHLPAMSVLVADTDKAPMGYGYAWSRFDSDHRMFILIPFNLIAALVRAVYIRCIRGFYFQRLVDRIENLEFILKEQEDGRERDRQFFTGLTEKI